MNTERPADDLASEIRPRRRVYLLRHAEVEYFAAGRAFVPELVPLNDIGRRQAQAAAGVLADVSFDRVLTSGLARTEETARLVLGNRAVPIMAEPRFREIETGRMSEWERVPPGFIRQAILGAFSDKLTAESRFLAGETFGACAERVLAAWADLLQQRDWQTVLVVGHGVVNRLLLGHLLGMPLSALGKLEQDACCINLLEVGENDSVLVRMINVTADDPSKRHLPHSTLEALYLQYLRGRVMRQGEEP